MSPSDKHEDVTEKVEEFLDAGVALVWILDPDFDTVTVHRPNNQPQLFNREDELTAEPHLPGFRVRVVELFE
jgi:Uma2 family endonuclease